MGLLAVIFFTAALAQTAAAVPPEGEWVLTGPPAAPVVSILDLGTLVNLPSGAALLTGKSVQRYDSATGAWVAAGSLISAGGVPTVLANGKILISGLAPAEVYDPVAQSSSPTGAMNFPRRGHQATLLLSGDVLVSGGVDINLQLVPQAEIYHAGSGTWTVSGTMNNPRTGHTAIRLPAGNVLAAGGSAPVTLVTSAELFDPATGNWTLTASNDVGGAVSVLLPNGQALVVGNAIVDNTNTTASQSFNPASGTWSPAVSVPGFGSSQPRALVKLNDGQDLLIGTGLAGSCFVLNAGLFDPAAGTWLQAATPLSNSGDFPSLAVLPDGRALLAYTQGCISGLEPAAQLFRPDNSSPHLSVSPATLDLGNVHVGGATQKSITVQDTGEAHLDGSAILSNSPGFGLVSGSIFSLDPGGSSSLVVSFTGASLGAFTGTALVRSNGGWTSVPLTATVGFLLSGRVTRSVDGSGVSSLLMTLEGPVNSTTTTDANGNYSFSVPAGSYTITPIEPSLTFAPANRNVVVSNADMTGLDFLLPTSLVASVLPGSRAVQIGTAATAFATVINISASQATDCSIAPITSIPDPFTYQTTDPATNALIGTPNTPVSIPAGQFQTFVFAVTPHSTIPPTDVQLSFVCTNTNPAPIYSGVNTFLLSASPNPRPDMVALAATLKQDGIVEIPGLTKTGIFAVATVNVGATGVITAVANTGSVALPVNVFVCETVPATGAL